MTRNAYGKNHHIMMVYSKNHHIMIDYNGDRGGNAKKTKKE
jgi:hypothetical protein